MSSTSSDWAIERGARWARGGSRSGPGKFEVNHSPPPASDPVDTHWGWGAG